MRMSSTLTRRVALLSASALIACGALLGAATPAAAEKVKIVLPTPPNTFGVPHYIAEDKGWYKEQGLEIEELLVQGDATAFRTLMSGDGDFTLIGPSTAMNGYLKGAKVKVFGAWQSTVDYQLIGNKEKLSGKIDKTMEGKVMAGSGGVSMLNHMIAMVLKKHNLDASGLKNIAIGGHADRLAGVIAGKADMTLVSTLFAERAKDQNSLDHQYLGGARRRRLHLSRRARGNAQQSGTAQGVDQVVDVNDARRTLRRPRSGLRDGRAS